jgi:hypothetical protein
VAGAAITKWSGMDGSFGQAMAQEFFASFLQKRRFFFL